MLNDDYLPSVLRYSKVVVLCFSLIASLLGQGDRVGLPVVNKNMCGNAGFGVVNQIGDWRSCSIN